MSRVGAFFKHVKTGGVYRITSVATMRHDLTPLIIYQSVDTKQVWARPSQEFYEDGRFKEIGRPAEFEKSESNSGRNESNNSQEPGEKERILRLLLAYGFSSTVFYWIFFKPGNDDQKYRMAVAKSKLETQTSECHPPI